MKIRVEKLTDTNKFGAVYGLISEDDEILFTHFCSNKSFAYGDLYENRPDRIKELTDRFGKVELIKD